MAYELPHDAEHHHLPVKVATTSRSFAPHHPSPARTTASISASTTASSRATTTNYSTARFRSALVPHKQAPPNHFYRVHVMHSEAKKSSPPRAANVRRVSVTEMSEKERNCELVQALKTPQPAMYLESPPTLVLSPSEKHHHDGGGLSAALPSIGYAHTPRPPHRPGRSPQDVHFSLPPLVPTVPTQSAIKALSLIPSVYGQQGDVGPASSSDDDDVVPASASAVTSSLERRLSRLTQGQWDATKKAAARVLQMMFSINISKTSRCVAMFQTFPQHLLGRSLYHRCRGGKRSIRKEEFCNLLRQVANDCQQSNATTITTAADDDEDAATFIRRPSRAVMMPTAEDDGVVAPYPSGSPRHGSTSSTTTTLRATLSPTQPLLAAKLRRDDTDPIFSLFDPEDTGVVGIRQVRDRFFSVALATKADVLYKLIRLVFANTTYHTLESTISRFELQMMAQLLHEVLVLEDGAMERALKLMHERDREVLVLYEVSHPRFASNSIDEAPAGKERDASKLNELRAAVYQSSEERKARMQELLDAVSLFPDQLNQTARGCVTIRELRALCDVAHHNICGTEVVEPSQETGWKRTRRSVVVRRHRYDAAFLTLASYIQLSQPPALANLVVKAGKVAHAAALISGGRMGRSGTQQDESLFEADVVSKASGGAKTKEVDPEYDPILSEAVEDQERIAQQQRAAAKRQQVSAALVASLSRSGSNASARRGEVAVPSNRKSSTHKPATNGAGPDDSPLRGVGKKTNSFVRQQESPVTSSPSPLGEEHRSLYDNPPEHGNPTYESRLGVVYKKSASHPAGKPVHQQ